MRHPCDMRRKKRNWRKDLSTKSVMQFVLGASQVRSRALCTESDYWLSDYWLTRTNRSLSMRHYDRFVLCLISQRPKLDLNLNHTMAEEHLSSPE